MWFEHLYRRLCAVSLFVAFMMASGLGCQFAPKSTSAPWIWKKETAKPVPERILPVWSDTVLHQTNQPGVRGFGGRVYFYGKENTAPVEVDGSLAIYVFDADDFSPSNQKPLRKYMFTADQFKSHMSKTSIGPSYSVWLPWGDLGGPPRRLSLIARFEGREGGTTISDPTIKMLPGIPENKELVKGELSNSKSSPVNLAGHSVVALTSSKKDDPSEPGIARNIETIDLPPAFHRHLRKTGPSVEPLRTTPAEAQTMPESDPPSVESPGKAIAPITTQVYDYRTRGQLHRTSMFGARTNKTDIREGRAIKSISRSDKREFSHP